MDYLNNNKGSRTPTQLKESDKIAEAQVLGSVLFEPDLVPDVCAVLGPDDFSDAMNRVVYQASSKVFSETRTVDTGALVREMNNTHGIAIDRAQVAVCDLMAHCVATTLLQRNVALVKTQSQLREMGHLATDLIKAAASRDVDGAHSVIHKMQKIRDGEQMMDAVTMTEAALGHASWFKRIEQKSLQKYTTGVRLFDEDINSLYQGGMMEGQMGIIGGRTGAGKTTIATYIASQVAIRSLDHRVHVFSLELKPEHIAAKGVAMAQRRSGVVGSLKSEQITNAAHAMRGWADRITISEERTPMQIFSRARKMARQGTTLFVLDHLHRIKLSDPRGGSARFEYGEFCRDITDAAKDEGALWLMAAQLNRESVKQNRPPMLSDLCESSMIEQHSDFVVGIHYPQPMNRNSVQLMVLKNRWGSANASQTVSMDWKGQSLTA